MPRRRSLLRALEVAASVVCALSAVDELGLRHVHVYPDDLRWALVLSPHHLWSGALFIGLLTARRWAAPMFIGFCWMSYVSTWEAPVLAAALASGLALFRARPAKRMTITWLALGAAVTLIVRGVGYDMFGIVKPDALAYRVEGPIGPAWIWIARVAVELGAMAALVAFARGRTWAALTTTALVITLPLLDLLVRFPPAYQTCFGGVAHSLAGDGEWVLAACLLMAVAPWLGPLSTGLRRAPVQAE